MKHEVFILGQTIDQKARRDGREARGNEEMEDFKENLLEKTERRELEDRTLAYIFLNEHLKSFELHEFKDLYAYSKKGLVEKSNIHYMELVDENPDSSDTIRYVAELLLNATSSEDQGGYVIVVGDGKTYQHLIKVKQTYGSTFNKLLIFPGDWHTLANFQPVLMKIYYHAGLKQLAQVSGYRAETLTALENCSNFSRTHHKYGRPCFKA